MSTLSLNFSPLWIWLTLCAFVVNVSYAEYHSDLAAAEAFKTTTEPSEPKKYPGEAYSKGKIKNLKNILTIVCSYYLILEKIEDVLHLEVVQEHQEDELFLRIIVSHVCLMIICGKVMCIVLLSLMSIIRIYVQQ